MKTKRKLFEATILIECEQQATKYIAESICEGLQEPTAVKYISIKEVKKQNKTK